jgi:hypothetical protein
MELFNINRPFDFGIPESSSAEAFQSVRDMLLYRRDWTAISLAPL